jgi:hypothetical protein
MQDEPDEANSGESTGTTSGVADTVQPKHDIPSSKGAAAKRAGTTQPLKKASAKKRSGLPKPYPVYTLEKALSVAFAIKDKNAGNPWPPTEVAAALGISQKSSSIDTLYRASTLYGLTSGTRSASYISIEKMGREIVYAPSPDKELIAKRQAFLNVELFSKVLEYYKGNNLPEVQFLSNTLVNEFGLPKEFHEEFRQIFVANCRFVEIGSEWQGLDTPGDSIVRSRSEAPSVVSYASASNVDGKSCFVIMPFSERLSKRPVGFFDEVFESLIKPAAEGAGFDVQTANKDGSDVIQSTIINELIDAELVIADLTDHNPNVLFELGFRMAQEKPVAIIKTSDTGGIFDVDNMLRVFEYSENLWTSTIKHDVPRLEGHLRATWDGRETNRSYISILRAKA